MAHSTTRPRTVARLVTVALWGVGSAYLLKSELAAPSPDIVVLASTPIVWAVIISLPILASYARRDGKWLAMALIWLAALVGSAYTLQATLGRQAENRDVLISKAADVAKQRTAIERDLTAAKAMLATARAKCGEGRQCLPATLATIGVYEGAVAGHEHRLSRLTVSAPDAGERRIAALLSFATGAKLENVAASMELPYSTLPYPAARDDYVGFYLRVRPKLGPDGKVISAHYAKIQGPIRSGFGWVSFRYYYNPVADDRRLVMDLEKNLLKPPVGTPERELHRYRPYER